MEDRRGNKLVPPDREGDQTMGREDNGKSNPSKMKGKKRQPVDKLRETGKINAKEPKTIENKCNEKKGEKEELKSKKIRAEEPGKGHKLKVCISADSKRSNHTSTRQCEEEEEEGSKGKGNENKGKKSQMLNKASKPDKEEKAAQIKTKDSENKNGISSTRPTGRSKVSSDPSDVDSESSEESSEETSSSEDSTDHGVATSDPEVDKPSTRKGIPLIKGDKKDSDHNTDRESTDEERDTGGEGVENEGLADKTLRAEDDRSSNGEDSEQSDSVTGERGSRSKQHTTAVSHGAKENLDSEWKDEQADDNEVSVDGVVAVEEKQVKLQEPAESEAGCPENTRKRRMLQMDMKKKLLVGMKVKAKGESQGTVQSEVKAKSKTREKFSKVHVQQRYQARMCKVVGKSSTEKQCIKEGGESGEEQNVGKLTVEQTFPSARLLSHQAHLIHSLRTKSKDIRSRSNRTLAVGAGKSDLSPLPEVAIKSHQDAPVKEVLTDQTPVKSAQKERRRESSASDVESHNDGNQQTPAQQLMALARKKKIAKVVGKVKLASVRKSAAKTRRTEEITAAENLTEAEPGSAGIKKNLCQRFSVIRRVTGWISRQIPKVLKTRSKLVTVTHVIGTTEWIAKTLSMKRKNKEGKRCNFRRRMAIRLASTAGLASRGGHCPWNKSEALKEEAKEDGGLLQVTESVHGADDATAKVSVDVQPVSEVEANTQDTSQQSEGQREAEEKLGNSDARYAIVLPRVHQLVKSKATVLASCRSERNHSDSPQPYKAAVPAQPEHSIVGLVRKSQNEPRGKLHTPRDFGPSNSERNDSNLQPRDTRNGPHYLQTDTRPRPMNKALMKDQNSRQFTLSDSQAPPTSQMRTDPCQQITRAQDDKYFQDGKEIHWARRGHFNNDHLTWLDSETLLPHLTIENLSKWTMYKEQGVVRTQRRTGTWEPEDTAENILEKDFTLKQVLFQRHFLFICYNISMC